MRKFFKVAVAAATLGGVSLAAVQPAEARDHGGAAVAAGIIGLGVGAALASSSHHGYYDRGYDQRGYYDAGYQPYYGGTYYTPAYGYDYRGGWDRGHWDHHDRGYDRGYDHGDRGWRR